MRNIYTDLELLINEAKDEKRLDILVKYDNGVEQKQMEKTDKDKDKRDDLITIVFKATDRLEPIIITREMKNKEKGRDENDEDNNEIMNNNNNSKSKNNYFVLAEKVLGSSLVTAFEVRNSSIELNSIQFYFILFYLYHYVLLCFILSSILN